MPYPGCVERVQQVGARPEKPILIYDGDCGFCKAWVSRWQEASAGRVEFVPLQAETVAHQFPELARADLETEIHWVDETGHVARGAEAVFRCLAAGQGSAWHWWAYQHLPGWQTITEWVYARVARHRVAASRISTLLWGPHVARPKHLLVRGLFLRLIGLVYFIAFLSMGTQVLGLIGSQGILPVGQLMELVQKQAAEHSVGWSRYWQFPTLCWWNHSDWFVRGLCQGGVVVSILVILGIAPAICLGLLWILYLSLVTAGQVFLGFQWDNLLLETGFLAILLAPWKAWPGGARDDPPSRLAILLLRWLLFRLMFASGCVKLLSGDATWHDWTALSYHYETQPLPTWIGWYAHQLPVSAQKLSVGVMYFIELILPFLIFAPRRVRFLAMAAMTGFQVLIALTGNYCFFNLLTLSLCVLLLDDAALQACLPQGLRQRLVRAVALEAKTESVPARQATMRPNLSKGLARARAAILIAVTLVIAVLSLVQVADMFRWVRNWHKPVVSFYQTVAPLRSMNQYGLFAVMTTQRLEIVIEGSMDGKTWRPYEFNYKPGDPQRAPAFVAPHQPRLDWQMWFAALSDYRRNPWVIQLAIRLLEGSPAVLRLLHTNPFDHQPPTYVRALVYRYRFTGWKERRSGAGWWAREYVGVYLAPIGGRR